MLTIGHWHQHKVDCVSQLAKLIALDGPSCLVSNADGIILMLRAGDFSLCGQGPGERR